MRTKGQRVKYRVIAPCIRKQILDQYNAGLAAGEERKAMVLRLQQEWMAKLKTPRYPFTERGLYRWAIALGMILLPTALSKGVTKCQ